ncbi:MAG: DUF1684 domain-containing protein [Chlorobiota bacterium]
MWIVLAVVASGWLWGCGNGEPEDDAGAPFDSLSLVLERWWKDSLFMHSPDSPIPEGDRPKFQGLSYYPPAAEFVLPAVLQKFEQPSIVELPSTKSGGVHRMVLYGVFHVAWQDTVFQLTAYKLLGAQGDILFVPFKDSTTGHETYEGGRYLELPEVDGEEYWLDFNRAYHPYCAYNPAYACPLVPPENVLLIPVRAGERLPTGKR